MKKLVYSEVQFTGYATNHILAYNILAEQFKGVRRFKRTVRLIGAICLYRPILEIWLQ